MATFNFFNKRTKKHFTKVMSIAEADAYTKANPHIDWLCSAAPSGDIMRLGMGKKPDDGFRDRLREIKKKSGRGNTINTW